MAKYWPETTDDRGRLLDPQVWWRPRFGWRPRWLGSGAAPPELESRFIASARMRVRRFWSVAIPVALVLWIVGAAATYATSQDRGMYQIGYLMIIVGLIVAFLLGSASQVYSDRLVLRMPVAEFGLCSNCGKQLPLDGPITFDGCTVCTGCKRAWKRPPLRAY
ncbi:MAG: hypothetical protein KF859_10245 [Phycisphaeraceae bacterium]|nr:hypothetical protein [Phycisphaeraceae bacterium]